MVNSKILVQMQYCPKNHPCPVASRCPVGAISQADSFSAPIIDENLCISCGMCTRMCRVFTEATS